MEKLTDEQIDDLMFYMGKPHTISARNQSDRYVEALIAEVREYRRRAVTDGRYDNEMVIAENEGSASKWIGELTFSAAPTNYPWNGNAPDGEMSWQWWHNDRRAAMSWVRYATYEAIRNALRDQSITDEQIRFMTTRVYDRE